MNKTYALVWNPNQGCWNAVGETARRRGKSSGGTRLAAVAAVSLLGFAALPAHALPTGEAIASGKADIARGADGKSMSINQHTDKLVTNWQDFSVANGERVSFQQPGSQSIALNRVIGNNGSQIHGSIDANGRVFLVNPNGVLFGSGAQVDVGGLVASTKNLSDADFLANNFRFTGDSAQSVVNDGRITAADGGSVALLGARVANNGTIQAKLGNVALGAGDAFNVSFDGNGLLNLQVESGAVDAQASNGGLIKADGGNVLMTARAADNLLNAVVNQTGTIEAKGLSSRGGKITLDGGTVNVGGKLDASAAAGTAAGSVTTRGEHVNVAADTTVDTRAGNTAGTWAIEAANAGVNAATARGAGRSIDSDTLSRNLGTTNVALTNTTGDLTVDGAVAWNSDNALALTARNGNVDLQQALSATGANARVSVNAADKVRLNNAIKLTGDNAALELNAKNGHALAGDNAVVTLSGKNATFRANGDDYKVLHTVDDLRNVDSNLNGRYVLGNAIDGKNARFQSIGGKDGIFAGTFDGLGNSIARLGIFNTGMNLGLFAQSGGRIANLALDSLAIAAPPNLHNGSVGGLVGSTRPGEGTSVISNVTAKNMNVTYNGPTWTFVGGLVGYNGYGTIENARFEGKVSGGAGTFATGGLAGVNLGTIVNSHVLANTVVTSTNMTNINANIQNTGGLVGINSGVIASSRASGRVTTRDNTATGGLAGDNFRGVIRDSSSSVVVSSGMGGAVGGLVGQNREGGLIENAYATGSVTTAGGGTVGGFVGDNVSGTIRNASTTVAVSTGRDGDVGGFAGRTRSGGTIVNSDATGTVTANGSTSIGGFVGNNGGKLEDVLSKGAVSDLASRQVGGLAGVNSGTVAFSSASSSVKAGNGSHTGGLVGLNSGTIDTSDASGSVVAGNSSHAGGLVGLNSGTIVTGDATGSVVAGRDSRVGGLVGTNLGANGVIRNSTSSSSVTAQRSDVGGLVGINEKGATVASSSSFGSVTGELSNLGGLVGTNYGTLTASTTSATIAPKTINGGSWFVGGLAGWNFGTIDSSSTSGPARNVAPVGLNLGTVVSSR
ncbi:GLUG motif-containing protein [Burkholderia cenocepacia]|uniref:two-partner secretion domain-containing protein n=1 Tax=Burkholderia cenocepacia TaxID=95486 RepID=UPI002AB67E58|nr:GLUG motif-containing protein [Burkholderia cenocepacia]